MSASTSSTTSRPPASPSAVSTESVSRRLHALARDEAVDDDLDVVLELLLERGRLGELHDLAVDPGAREALALQLLEQVGVLALAAADDRREHLVPRALRQLEQPVDDLLRRLRGDALAADRAVLRARARVQSRRR